MDWFNNNYWYPMERKNLFLNKDQRGWYFGGMDINDQALKNVRLRVVYRYEPWTWMNGSLTKKGDVYMGDLCAENPGLGCRKFTMRTVPNPFYFKIYQPEN